MQSARDFFLSYKKKFVTKFVTCITKFVTRVSKFVTSVTKFVTKNILADSKKLLDDREKFQGERKKLLGDAKETSQRRIDFKQGHPTHRLYKYVCPFLRRKYVVIFLHFRKHRLTLYLKNCFSSIFSYGFNVFRDSHIPVPACDLRPLGRCCQRRCKLP